MKKNKGRKFEDKIRKTIASGALWFDKGDLKTDNYLIECKYTDKKSYRIKQKTIFKIWNEAFESNKFPKIIIAIPRNEKELFILNCNIEVIKK